VTGSDIDLSAVAVAVGEPLASRVLDGHARLDPVPVAGTEETAVWSVLDEFGDHPMRLYVGRWPDGPTRVLTADQDAWTDLVATVGVHLTDPDQALAYVEAFLEITRGNMVIVRPVTTLDDLRWRPGSTEEQATKESLLDDPPDMTPVVETEQSGFHIELTLVVDQRLQRNTFDVSPNGEITSSYRVIVEGLPLPIAR
jgi:hypothetical protein